MRIFRRLLVIAAVLFALALVFGGPGEMPVEPGSTLVVDLGGGYVESAESPLLARLVGERQRTFASQLSELRKAERDDRIGAVLLRIRNLQIGWAKAQELRSAIQSLSAAGHETVAYLEVASLGANIEYYVASAADRVISSPGNASPLVGLAAEFLFFGGMWEKIGAGLEVEGVGEYKSAAETLSGTEMSPAHREMANSLLDSTNEQFLAGIASSRGTSEELVRDAIDAAPATPEDLLAIGLIDDIDYLDRVIEDLSGGPDGPVVDDEDYAAVDPASVGFEPVAKFALVYGSGTVLVGSGAQSPTGGLRLASDTVAAALQDAANDPEIDAIVFRIDSPGGSPLAAEIVWRASQLARANDKPLVASFSDVAASGGYYVACGADAIVASPGSLVGSIGVFAIRPVLAGLFEEIGIGVEGLTRGAHADMLLASRPLSESGRRKLRSELVGIYELFLRRVADGRGLDVAAVDAVARGRVWTGAQALEQGLVDELGGLREAVALAKQKIDLAPDADVLLVPYPQPKSVVEQLDDVLRQASAGARLELPLPGIARDLLHWVASLEGGGPQLIPPFLVSIH